MTDKPKDAAPALRTVEGHSEERFLGSDVFESSGRNLPPPRRGGTVREEAREIEAKLTHLAGPLTQQTVKRLARSGMRPR